VDAERLPAMCGIETLTMVVSSTSMNVGKITAAAIIHGFIFIGASLLMAQIMQRSAGIIT